MEKINHSPSISASPAFFFCPLPSGSRLSLDALPTPNKVLRVDFSICTLQKNKDVSRPKKLEVDGGSSPSTLSDLQGIEH